MIIFVVWVAHSIVLCLGKTKAVGRPGRRLFDSTGSRIEESKLRQW